MTNVLEDLFIQGNFGEKYHWSLDILSPAITICLKSSPQCKSKSFAISQVIFQDKVETIPVIEKLF